MIICYKGVLNKNAFFILQLEKAREATDAANLRAAYAEVMTSALTGATGDELPSGVSESSGTYSKDVTLTQKQSNWTDTSIKEIGGVDVTKLGVGDGVIITVSYSEASGASFEVKGV